jgi:hypothetical protein
MTRLRHAALAAAFLGFAAGPAWAQATAPATPAPATNLDSKPGTLSDKLSDTNGVIKPTGNVDPEMHKAAPQAGTMPVIKPGAVAPGTAK